MHKFVLEQILIKMRIIMYTGYDILHSRSMHTVWITLVWCSKPSIIWL